MDLSALARHPATWIAVTVEIIAQMLAALYLAGIVQGLVVALSFGLLIAFLAGLAERPTNQ